MEKSCCLNSILQLHSIATLIGVSVMKSNFDSRKKMLKSNFDSRKNMIPV